MAGWHSFFLYDIHYNLERQFKIAKYVYSACYLLISVVMWMLRDYADEWFAANRHKYSYCQDNQYENLCSGITAAKRFSFANFVFFFAHAVLMFGCKRETDRRVGIHLSMWFWKLALWGGLIVAFLFVSDDVITVYSQIARIGSGLFLVFQVLELINGIYFLNEYLLRKGGKWCTAALVAGSLLTFSMATTLIALSYHYYAASSGCHLNLAFISLTLIAGVFMTAVLFVPNRVASAGLLTSNTIFLYCSYLLFSALNSEEASECTRGGGTSGSWLQIVGFFLTLLTVNHSITRTAGGGVLSSPYEPPNILKAVELPYRPDFFHLILAVASMHLAMILSNYQVTAVAGSKFEIDKGWVSTWVKMTSKWGCEIVYFWTVVAPAMLPHREFSSMP